MDTEAQPAPHWDGVVSESLAKRWNVPAVHSFARVGSTNDVARGLAEAGAPHGSVVIADEQTAGRGRESRYWSSPAGLGVWTSLILRPHGAVEPTILPLLVGLGVAEALDQFCPSVFPQIKWPNDLFLGGRKVGGILCEGAWNRDSLTFVIVGIGVNVLHSQDDFPVELRARATSVRISASRQPSRVDVAGAILGSVLAAVSRPVLDGARLRELERRDLLRGNPVAVAEPSGTQLRGVAMGVTPDGYLLLRTEAGVLRVVRAGSVRIAPRADHLPVDAPPRFRSSAPSQ